MPAVLPLYILEDLQVNWDKRNISGFDGLLCLDKCWALSIMPNDVKNVPRHPTLTNPLNLDGLAKASNIAI